MLLISLDCRLWGKKREWLLLHKIENGNFRKPQSWNLKSKTHSAPKITLVLRRTYFQRRYFFVKGIEFIGKGEC